MVRGLICIIVTVLGVPASGADLTLSGHTRRDLLKSQLQVLDDRAASQYSNSIVLQPPRAIIPGTPAAIARLSATDSPYLGAAQAAAKSYQIPEALFLALIQQESGWNPKARSPKGALGLAQLMPATARGLRVNALSPTENLQGGARYLRMMHDRFGSWKLALAAYNAGPEAVEEYKGIPPYRETQSYVRAILNFR
jgi:soluble lytic murein transglycosylase-like protein